jgi:hypothetical protein
MKERKPFNIKCQIEYDIVNQNDEIVLSESSLCSFEILKASLPISINKILQRTGHIQIGLGHLKKSEKKDRIQTGKDYMMYLYVTSILKRESLLVSHLNFKSGKHTQLKNQIQWENQENEQIALKYFENDPESN